MLEAERDKGSLDPLAFRTLGMGKWKWLTHPCRPEPRQTKSSFKLDTFSQTLPQHQNTQPLQSRQSVTMAEQQKTLSLTATYKCPTSEPFTTIQSIVAPPSTSAADKTAYLSSLRQALASTQEQINKELTERMEQDRAREGNNGKGVDDAKEEENYGEEVVEDED